MSKQKEWLYFIYDMYICIREHMRHQWVKWINYACKKTYRYINYHRGVEEASFSKAALSTDFPNVPRLGFVGRSSTIGPAPYTFSFLYPE